MNQLKVGVIGVGHLGQHHARIYSAMSEAELVALFDLDQVRAKTLAERYGVSFCTDLFHLLPQVHAVSVAVPTSAHYSVVEVCLKAGLHVLVEKPIAASLSEGQDLVRMAKEKGRILQVGHVERFNPIGDVVRPYIKQPGFIECHRLSPFQPRGTDVDVVLDLMIHDLDMILSFNLGVVQKVEAAGVTVLSDYIDIANARIEFSQGCVANLTASRVSTGRLRKLRVFQRNSYLSVDYQAGQAVIHQRVSDGGHGHDPSIKTGHLHAEKEEPLQRELSSFVKAVRDGTCPLVPGDEAVASLELAYRVLEAIRASTGFLENPEESSLRSTYSS